MKRQLYTVYVFAKLNARRFFRDRLAIFFTIVFPLIFLLIFGNIFKGNNVSFKVTLINQSNSIYAKQFVDGIEQSKFLK